MVIKETPKAPMRVLGGMPKTVSMQIERSNHRTFPRTSLTEQSESGATVLGAVRGRAPWRAPQSGCIPSPLLRASATKSCRGDGRQRQFDPPPAGQTNGWIMRAVEFGGTWAAGHGGVVRRQGDRMPASGASPLEPGLHVVADSCGLPSI
jgi:hypothetical protein